MVKISVIYKLFQMLLDALPDSPIQQAIADFKSQEWLGYLNYFVPISFMVNVTAIWVGVLATYTIVKYVFGFIRSILK